VVVHDFMHQALDRGVGAAPWWKRPFLQFEAARTRRWETEIVKKPSDLLTSNDKDRDIAQNITGRRDVVTRYSEIDPLYAGIKRDPAKLRKGVIFFWGLMSRPENEDAMVWFASEILPKIRRHRPHARLVIAGAEPSKAVLALKGEPIDVLGFVKDPVPIFESVEMAVAPLRLGSGLKIKVVEFLAAGIPTVATNVGAEGVKPSPFLVVANEPEAFAQACLKFLSE
jgi:glycosyltransferase involved in cell wall biosynthesis